MEHPAEIKAVVDKIWKMKNVAWIWRGVIVPNISFIEEMDLKKENNTDMGITQTWTGRHHIIRKLLTIGKIHIEEKVPNVED